MFLADAMLGRLAKWLRLIGFDTLYAGRLPAPHDQPGRRARSDHQLAALARAQGRIVLTRDRAMARRRGIRCLYIDSQVWEEQLGQVIVAFGLPSTRHVRCPVCNGPLTAIPPSQVRSHVPAFVWKTHSRFHHCAECAKYYWPGSHWERIQEIVAGLVELGRDDPARAACAAGSVFKIESPCSRT